MSDDYVKIAHDFLRGALTDNQISDGDINRDSLVRDLAKLLMVLDTPRRLDERAEGILERPELKKFMAEQHDLMRKRK